ncbi:MAG: hypothetical protein ACKOQW_00885 [Phycisphaerales bacterium]
MAHADERLDPRLRAVHRVEDLRHPVPAGAHGEQRVDGHREAGAHHRRAGGEEGGGIAAAVQHALQGAFGRMERQDEGERREGDHHAEHRPGHHQLPVVAEPQARLRPLRDGQALAEAVGHWPWAIE